MADIDGFSYIDHNCVQRKTFPKHNVYIFQLASILLHSYKCEAPFSSVRLSVCLSVPAGANGSKKYMFVFPIHTFRCLFFIHSYRRLGVTWPF